MCIPSAPEPGGITSPAEAGRTGNQCKTCRGHARSGGSRAEAESSGGRGQAQVLGSGGTCPNTTRVRLLNIHCQNRCCVLLSLEWIDTVFASITECLLLYVLEMI